MFSPPECSTNEHDWFNSVVWGLDPLSALFSSCQSGYCLSHSLAPQCHQLARAQVSLRHRRCCLPPSVTSLIISVRWLHYLTHRNEVGNTARAHTDAHTRHIDTTLATHDNTHPNRKWPPWERRTHRKHTLHVYVPTRSHAWTQSMCQHLSVFCSDNYRNEGWMMKCRMIGEEKKSVCAYLEPKSRQLCKLLCIKQRQWKNMVSDYEPKWKCYSSVVKCFIIWNVRY